MKSLVLTVGIFAVFSSIADAALNGKRNGRFFLVSTSTSTLTTTTICYVAVTSPTTCGRKKRSIDGTEIEDLEIDPNRISPSALENEEEDDELISSSMKDEEIKPRDPRFLLFWATSTTTSTSYSSTSTLATLDCTPTSYSLSACG